MAFFSQINSANRNIVTDADYLILDSGGTVVRRLSSEWGIKHDYTIRFDSAKQTLVAKRLPFFHHDSENTNEIDVTYVPQDEEAPHCKTTLKFLATSLLSPSMPVNPLARTMGLINLSLFEPILVVHQEKLKEICELMAEHELDRLRLYNYILLLMKKPGQFKASDILKHLPVEVIFEFVDLQIGAGNGFDILGLLFEIEPTKALNVLHLFAIPKEAVVTHEPAEIELNPDEVPSTLAQLPPEILQGLLTRIWKVERTHNTLPMEVIHRLDSHKRQGVLITLQPAFLLDVLGISSDGDRLADYTRKRCFRLRAEQIRENLMSQRRGEHACEPVRSLKESQCSEFLSSLTDSEIRRLLRRCETSEVLRLFAMMYDSDRQLLKQFIKASPVKTIMKGLDLPWVRGNFRSVRCLMFKELVLRTQSDKVMMEVAVLCNFCNKETILMVANKLSYIQRATLVLGLVKDQIIILEVMKIEDWRGNYLALCEQYGLLLQHKKTHTMAVKPLEDFYYQQLKCKQAFILDFITICAELDESKLNWRKAEDRKVAIDGLLKITDAAGIATLLAESDIDVNSEAVVDSESENIFMSEAEGEDTLEVVDDKKEPFESLDKTECEKIQATLMILCEIISSEQDSHTVIEEIRKKSAGSRILAYAVQRLCLHERE